MAFWVETCVINAPLGKKSVYLTRVKVPALPALLTLVVVLIHVVRRSEAIRWSASTQPMKETQ